MTITVGRASWQQTRELRHAVLRPGLPVGILDSPMDGVAVEIAAWDGERLVGTARVFSQPWDGDPFPGSDSGAWQLRGMAVEPAYQGQGIGGRVLAEAVTAAREGGAFFLWANARTSALGFYQRHGWAARGEEFIYPESGIPHYKVTFTLALTT